MRVRSKWLGLVVMGCVLAAGCSSSSDDGEGPPISLEDQDGGVDADAGLADAGSDAGADAGTTVTCAPSETECTGSLGSACCAPGFQCSSGMCAALAPRPMGISRDFPGAATTRDGRILAIGGAGSTSADAGVSAEAASSEAYDPARNEWTPIASLPAPPVPNFTSAATAQDGRVYAFAGANGFVYDPATDAWTALPPIPAPRHSLALAAGADGRVYAMGGFSPDRNRPVSDVHAFDPATGEWTEVAPMPTPRVRLAAVTGPDGLIYAIGGVGETEMTAAVDIFDPATGAWSEATPMPTARGELAAAFGPDGLLYAIGGFDTRSALDTVERFDPAANTWTEAPALPVAREGAAAATGLGENGLIYVIGGGTATVVAFNTATGTWL